jgi:hypothetical protein
MRHRRGKSDPLRLRKVLTSQRNLATGFLKSGLKTSILLTSGRRELSNEWQNTSMASSVYSQFQLPENAYRILYIYIYTWMLCDFLIPGARSKSRDSSVGIALGYELDGRGSRVRFPVGVANFSLHHRVQTGSGAHPASYPMGTRCSFPGCKAAEAWSWPLTSI